MRTVLVVDDQASNRAILTAILESKSFKTLEARDGVEAVALVVTQNPDLVITDILMPSMDGYELVRRIRELPGCLELPVVFWSAHYNTEAAIQLARKCGVRYVLAKNASPTDIAQTITDALAEYPTHHDATPGEDFQRDHINLVSSTLMQTTEDIRQANNRLFSLAEAGISIASTKQESECLDAIVRWSMDLCGAAIGIAVQFGADQHQVDYVSSAGLTSEQADAVRKYAFLEKEIRETVANRTTRVIDTFASVDLGASMLKDLLDTDGSALLCPIHVPGRVFGFVVLINRIGSRRFSENDCVIIDVLSAHAARCLENRRLTKDLRKAADLLRLELEDRIDAEKKVQRLARSHELLSRVNNLITRVRDKDELLRGACSIALNVGGFDGVWVGNIEKESKVCRPYVSEGTFSIPVSEIAIDFSESAPYYNMVAPLIGADAFPLVLNSPSEYPPSLGRSLGSSPLSRIVALPVSIDNSTISIITLYSLNRGAYLPNEISVLSDLAADIGFAIDHIGKVEKLDYLAFYDSLTGLANPSLFQERVHQYIATQSMQDRKTAVVCIELQRFHTIRETLDRRKQDSLIQQIAMRLSALVPSRDLAYFTPQKFYLTITGLLQVDDAARIVTDIMYTVFTRNFEVEDISIKVAAKAGISVSPYDGANADKLIRNAETAARRARPIDNSFLFFTSSMTERVSRRMSVEARLYKAINNQEFSLHYQPKLHVASNSVQSVEALLRWNDPDSGVILPGDFIPLLEETGAIIDVGYWILEEAKRTFARWKNRWGFAPRIACNVSAVQLQDTHFAEKLVSIVQGRDTGVDIEVTESFAVENIEDSIRKLNIIHDHGIDIAVDDFGTGYSSLSYISRLPIQAMKIDRSFVESMERNTASGAVVSAIANMAHAMRIAVVAEGVERVSQVDRLIQLECDELQGYFISRPLDRGAFETYFERSQSLSLMR